MSTGVGKGLALPHARSGGVTTTVAAFATTGGPVEYGSFDEQPVRLVLLLVGPDGERGTHVRLLSRVSRLMSDEAFRARLLAAGSEAEVLAAFSEAEDRLG
jgi:mannitol/fructose-specific phosphotransferase system IIA component (Ntr-type)